MPENIELFEEEIQAIAEYADINHEDFTIICNKVRKVLSEFGNQISPSVVVDLLESAISIYTISEVRKEIDEINQIIPEVAVSLAAKDLGLELEHTAEEDYPAFGSIKSGR